MSRRDAEALISVVVPAYNEAAVLETLRAAVFAGLEGQRAELIFVNDGSTDGSAEVLDRLAATDPRVRVVHLARNFGHQAALAAGLRYARGAAVAVMDADMQDDPAALAAMAARWREGWDVVYAVRHGRKEGALKRAGFYSFYRLLNMVSQTPFPTDAGNFGLMDRRVVDAVLSMPERDRYFAGLRRWVGFRQTGIPVERAARYDGEPRVSLLGLLRLAKSAVFSFSTVPLAVFYLIAAAASGAFFFLSGFSLYHKLVTGLSIPGWTSTVLISTFFGAINALGIGVLGDYVIRIYDQVRARPMFLVARTVNLEDEPSRPGRASPRDPRSPPG